MKTRLREHKTRYPNIFATVDKIIDLKNWDFVVSVQYRCALCGEKTQRDFRDRDTYPMTRAHWWFAGELAKHGHREQEMLAFEGDVEKG